AGCPSVSSTSNNQRRCSRALAGLPGKVGQTDDILFEDQVHIFGQPGILCFGKRPSGGRKMPSPVTLRLVRDAGVRKTAAQASSPERNIFPLPVMARRGEAPVP